MRARGYAWVRVGKGVSVSAAHFATLALVRYSERVFKLEPKCKKEHGADKMPQECLQFFLVYLWVLPGRLASLLGM